MKSEKRLIDADALMEQVKAIHRAVDTSGINRDYDTGFHSATSQIQGLIEYMPTIDAVEVVRCKDCKYWEYGKDYEPYCNHWKSGMADTVDDDFCSYGERSDSGGN